MRHRSLAAAVLSAGALIGGAWLTPTPVTARGQQAASAPPAAAQPSRGASTPAPRIVSPEVLADRRVTFRLRAPDATDVILRSLGRGAPPMTKGENGVWETTVGPLKPGAYLYTFGVHGVAVLDPSNQAVSESTTGIASLVVVPGSEWMDTKDIPHGAVAAVTYHSTVLGRDRRMHVYTPPNYGTTSERLPVFYLLHGSGDSDETWSSLGRAPAILDNLIAAGRAKPMLVVMPFGHTRPTEQIAASRTEFVQEFLTDIVPYIEKNYRVRADRLSRAVAGLSMGGGQTLNIVIPHMDKFAYAGIFSAGLGGGGAGQPSALDAWETANKAALDNEALRKSMKLVWFSTGKEDAAMTGTMNAVKLLNKHSFTPVFQESAGGHTWENWRDYLTIFTPQLFR